MEIIEKVLRGALWAQEGTSGRLQVFVLFERPLTIAWFTTVAQMLKITEPIKPY